MSWANERGAVASIGVVCREQEQQKNNQEDLIIYEIWYKFEMQPLDPESSLPTSLS